MKKTARNLLAFILVIALLAAFPAAASAETMDTRTLAMINKPGVVLVYTEWTADMTFYEFTVDDSISDYIIEDISNMLESGQLAEDDTAIMSAFIQLFSTYLPQFAYYTGNSETRKVSTGGMGTGFIVTPDGYLVTNAHVVNGNEDELYYNFAVSNLQSEADTEIQTMIEDMRRDGYDMSQDEIDMLYASYFQLLAQSFDLGNLQTSYQCFMGNVTPGSDVGVKGVSLDVRKVGEPSTAKDVAILKLEGSNLPTVALGDDSLIKTGDQVYAMGYPALATVMLEDMDFDQAMQEPTLTQGIVSAKKQLGSGSVIQMDASIHGGNSGGPLFNSAGEVVGINTFGLVDPETGASADGLNFAVPISTVKTYLNELNVTPSESKFTTDFKQSITDYNNGDYQSALELLRGINETNPGYPVVQELLADARAAADANPQPSAAEEEAPASSAEATAQPAKNDAKDNNSGLPVYLIIIIIAAAAAAVVVILVVLNKKKKAGIPPGGQGMGAAGFAPQSGQQPPQQPQPQPGQQPPQQPQPQSGQQPPQQPQPGQQQPYEPQPQYAPPQQAAPQAQQSVQPAQDDAVKCQGCGAELPAGSQFCNVCGQSAKKEAPANCPQCGAPTTPGSKFCNVCGHPME